MVRIVKEPTARRNEILDSARTLVYTKGYEQMTIQDILDRLQISKGAFYHYFDSKQDALDALVERLMDEGLGIINPIVDDPNLRALEKFRQYFDTAAQWKTGQKELFIALMKIWYADENALVRQKVFASAISRIAPKFGEIIRQGVQEGVFQPTYPEHVSQVVWALFQTMGDTVAMLMLSDDPNLNNLDRVEKTIIVYSDSLERVLGAPAGSLLLTNHTTLQEWLPPPGESSPKN